LCFALFLLWRDRKERKLVGQRERERERYLGVQLRKNQEISAAMYFPPIIFSEE